MPQQPFGTVASDATAALWHGSLKLFVLTSTYVPVLLTSRVSGVGRGASDTWYWQGGLPAGTLTVRIFSLRWRPSPPHALQGSTSSP